MKPYLLCLAFICPAFLIADEPPVPTFADIYGVSTPVSAPATRSDECDCQDKDEADGCACEDCQCSLCIGKPFSVTYAKLATPPVPSVESESYASSEAAVPNLNEAFRRLRASGYEWKEIDECELCDTCPAGFRYTGRTVFTAVKNYDEGQTVPTASGPSSPVYVSSPQPSCGTDLNYSVESNCGTETFMPAQTYAMSYVSEPGCGTESYASYPTQVYAAPMAPRTGIFGGGFLSRIRQRFSGPAVSYGPRYSGYTSYNPAYTAGPLRGACATGNCGF